jgi:hypothetical protein
MPDKNDAENVPEWKTWAVEGLGKLLTTDVAALGQDAVRI